MAHLLKWSGHSLANLLKSVTFKLPMDDVQEHAHSGQVPCKCQQFDCMVTLYFVQSPTLLVSTVCPFVLRIPWLTRRPYGTSVTSGSKQSVFSSAQVKSADWLVPCMWPFWWFWLQASASWGHKVLYGRDTEPRPVVPGLHVWALGNWYLCWSGLQSCMPKCVSSFVRFEKVSRTFTRFSEGCLAQKFEKFTVLR